MSFRHPFGPTTCPLEGFWRGSWLWTLSSFILSGRLILLLDMHVGEVLSVNVRNKVCLSLKSATISLSVYLNWRLSQVYLMTRSLFWSNIGIQFVNMVIWIALKYPGKRACPYFWNICPWRVRSWSFYWMWRPLVEIDPPVFIRPYSQVSSKVTHSLPPSSGRMMECVWVNLFHWNIWHT